MSSTHTQFYGDTMLLCPVTNRYTKAVPNMRDLLDGLPEWRVRQHCSACGQRIILDESCFHNDFGPCPTCDHCGLNQCQTENMEWNGETGCHVACEVEDTDRPTTVTVFVVVGLLMLALFVGVSFIESVGMQP